MAAVVAAIVSVAACGGRADGSASSGGNAETAGADADSGSSATPPSSGVGSSTGAGSSSGVGSSASSGSTPVAGDASPPPNGATQPGGTACWENQLPPEVQPILPTASVSASCVAAPSIVQWNAPVADAGTMSDADARAAIVGRWLSCSAAGGAFSSAPHAGMEFGANGRWRLLVKDSSGAVVPTTATGAGSQGRYYALATGQIDIRDDGISSLTTPALPSRRTATCSSSSRPVLRA